MSDWEADDYDPNAQLSGKLVELGLSDSQSKKGEKTIQQNDVGNTAKSTRRESNGKFHDLTEEEKRAAQLESDSQHTIDLFGIAMKPTNEILRSEKLLTKEDFIRYAEKLGAEILENSENIYYLDMITILIERIIKPMKKLQLETVEAIVRKHLDIYTKKEEDVHQKATEQKQQRQQKKANKKRLNEDLVEDDYVEYTEKYY